MKLTFFFPYHDVSGVPMLFSRLAVHFAESRGADVEVIDYVDGYMAGAVRGAAHVRVTPFTSGKRCPVEADRTLVMQSILPATIPRELAPDSQTRLLFWTLHPMNLVQTIIPTRWGRDFQARHTGATRIAGRTVMRRFTRQLRGFVADVDARNSLVFVDGTTYRVTGESLGLRLAPPRFVPTLAYVPSANPTADARAQDPLSVAWLGRLDDFKVPMLRHTLDGLSRLARRGPAMRFTIIGDGPLRHLVDDARFAHERFRIERTGTLPPQAVDRMLTGADLLFAMGTSAIEGGKLGVPTVLVDIAYGQVPDGYVFRWLHQAADFNLGSMLNDRPLVPGNGSLEQIIAVVVRDRPAASAATYGYCRERHSLESVTSRFLAAASIAQYRYGEMNPSVRQKGWLRSAYEHGRAIVRRRSAPLTTAGMVR